MLERVAAIRSAFGGRFDVSYAIKSNPSEHLLRTMCGIVPYLDASSIGEVHRALLAGFAPGQVTFSGPGKRPAELKRAVELGVGLLVCESADEVEQADAFAAECGRRQEVLLRINPVKVPQKFGAHMSGRGSQFGIDEEVIDAVVASRRNWRALDLRGFHIYAGSNCLVPDAIAENVQNCFDVFARLADRHDLSPSTLIVGSGFGIPYSDDQSPLDLSAVAALVNPILNREREHPRLRDARLLLETGRFVVGEAGYLVTSVIRAKESRGTRIAICDAGFNTHLAAFGLMGSVIRRNWPITKVAGGLEAPVVEHNVVGPLCTSIDILATRLRLPMLEAGDALAIGSSGAYGLTASPTRFISHPEPREFLVSGEPGRFTVEEITATTFSESLRIMTSPWDALLAVAREQPDHPAILVGSDVLSFRAWVARALRYAALYRQRGVTRHGRVLLWMESSPEMACALAGAWAAGGIPVLMDPRSGPLHFAHAVRTAAPEVIVMPRGACLPTTGDETGRTAESVTPDDADATAAGESVSGALPTDPASIVFTSGSTGQPKGVTQSHGNLVRGCLTVTGYLGTTHTDRILCPVPWSFDYGYGQLLTTAIRGATLILPTSNNPIGVCEAIERHKPTVFAGIPSVYTYLLRGVSPFRTTPIGSIATYTNTGGTIPAPILEELLGLVGEARVFLNYGLTETYRTSFLPPELVRERPTSIGHPIPQVDVVVVREDGTLAEPGEEGEFVHRGDFVCLGYWNDPESTARVRRPDPLAPPGLPSPPHVIFTGDYGTCDPDGFLYFHGRRDHQLKSMGVRVNPAEVEAILYQSGLITEVAVVGRKDLLVGDEVCAFVVAREAGAPVARDLGRFAREVMSPFMVPRRIVVKDALPKTTTGKINYPELRGEVGGIAKDQIR